MVGTLSGEIVEVIYRVRGFCCWILIVVEVSNLRFFQLFSALSLRAFGFRLELRDVVSRHSRRDDGCRRADVILECLILAKTFIERHAMFKEGS